MVTFSLMYSLQIQRSGDSTLVRRAVPLALALLHVSDPKVSVVNTLSRLSHDNQDLKDETAMAAILGMGLLGAGTNNPRVANLLRQLALYYSLELNQLFKFRIARDLMYCGKVLFTALGRSEETLLSELHH
jgi:26S proteasome regulatory subunit N1